MRFLILLLMMTLVLNPALSLSEGYAQAKESKKVKKIKKFKKVKKKKYRWVRASSKVNRYVDADKIKLESMVKDLDE